MIEEFSRVNNRMPTRQIELNPPAAGLLPGQIQLPDQHWSGWAAAPFFKRIQPISKDFKLFQAKKPAPVSSPRDAKTRSRRPHQAFPAAHYTTWGFINTKSHPLISYAHAVRYHVPMFDKLNCPRAHTPPKVARHRLVHEFALCNLQFSICNRPATAIGTQPPQSASKCRNALGSCTSSDQI